jgi:hypothetical protein
MFFAERCRFSAPLCPLVAEVTHPPWGLRREAGQLDSGVVDASAEASLVEASVPDASIRDAQVLYGSATAALPSTWAASVNRASMPASNEAGPGPASPASERIAHWNRRAE